jgi:hypothetical protein
VATLPNGDVAGSLEGHEPATGRSAVGSGKGEAAAVRQCADAAEGLSGPAQRFESAYRKAGRNFHWHSPNYSSRAIHEPEPNDGNNDAPLALSRRGVSLDDRTPELEAAIRAQDAVIAEAQRLLAGCRQPGGLTRDALIDELRKLFDGRQQRDAQRLSREALGEDFGNIA